MLGPVGMELGRQSARTDKTWMDVELRELDHNGGVGEGMESRKGVR